MDIPETSATTTGTLIAKSPQNVMPSKIPRPGYRKERPSSHSRQPSIAVPVVFDRDRGMIKSRNVPIPELAETIEDTSSHDTVCEEALSCSDGHLLRQVCQNSLQRDGPVIIRTSKKITSDESSTLTLTGIHDDGNMPDSSTNYDGGDGHLRKLPDDCRFEGECKEQKPERGFKWAAFCYVFMALMIVFVLAILLLANYDQLVATWYGYRKRNLFAR